MSDRSDEVVVPVDWGDALDMAEEAATPPPPPVPNPSLAPVPPPLPPSPPPIPILAARETRDLVRGQRSKLADLGLGTALEVVVQLAAPPGTVVDVTCLGLDAAGRLSDERYFVFYNQRRSPCDGVTLLDPAPTGATGAFRFTLDALPAAVHRLVVAASFDGAGEMNALGPSEARWQDERGPVAAFAFTGHDFSAEKALMVLELYRKDGVWRTAALGQGFAGGLAALLGHFGAQAS